MAIATMCVTVLDCPDPRRLAEFYARVLDWTVQETPYDGWVEIAGADGRRLAFQESPGHRPPEWPGVTHGQQFHLDLDVPRERMDEAEKQVLELGARLLQDDGGGERRFRVYADPAGHPFCLCGC